MADSTLAGTFKVSSTDATAVAGTLAWDNAATVVNMTGSFAWTFTPTDTTKYNVVHGTVNVTVNKITPVADTAVSATAITAGQTLADSTLAGTFKVSSTDATAVTGTLAWDNAATVVDTTGNFAWTFTPTDTTKYNVVTGTVSVTANYTVTYNGNTAESGTAPVDTNSPYISAATVTVLDNDNFVKSGYTFSGWNTQADGNGTSYVANGTFSITANTTLYAVWKSNDATLNVTGSTLDSIALIDNSTTETGADEINAKPLSVTIDDANAAAAVFVPVATNTKATVTVYADGGSGSGSYQPVAASYDFTGANNTLWIKVVAADGSTTLYYKATVIVNP